MNRSFTTLCMASMLALATPALAAEGTAVETPLQAIDDAMRTDKERSQKSTVKNDNTEQGEQAAQRKASKKEKRAAKKAARKAQKARNKNRG